MRKPMPRATFRLLTAGVLALLLSACSQPESTAPAEEAVALLYEETLRLELETAKPGDVIVVPEGVHEMSRGLNLNTDGVTIRGAGMDKSVLSFKNQVAGAEGLLVNASDFTIEDIALEDTVGDALKVNEGKNIVIRRVRTEWTRGPHTENGAYGIYPVQTENVLIDESVAVGASDAGIYVGQSRNVIVMGSRAEYNVAGIEIENTINADVFDNLATNNTGGILVFNMPDLPQLGHSTRVFNNVIVGNNTGNFAPPGGAVAGVPAGSGIVINANDKVEIFENEIADNQTANILISSYFSAGYSSDRETAETFDPYPEGIFIYNNAFRAGGNAPDREELETLRTAMFGADGSLPDIVWDGFVNPELETGNVLCVDNGESIVMNIDAAGGYENVTVDMSNHGCELDKLSEVVLAAG